MREQKLDYCKNNVFLKTGNQFKPLENDKIIYNVTRKRSHSYLDRQITNQSPNPKTLKIEHKNNYLLSQKFQHLQVNKTQKKTLKLKIQKNIKQNAITHQRQTYEIACYMDKRFHEQKMFLRKSLDRMQTLVSSSLHKEKQTEPSQEIKKKNQQLITLHLNKKLQLSQAQNVEHQHQLNKLKSINTFLTEQNYRLANQVQSLKEKLKKLQEKIQIIITKPQIQKKTEKKKSKQQLKTQYQDNTKQLNQIQHQICANDVFDNLKSEQQIFSQQCLSQSIQLQQSIPFINESLHLDNPSQEKRQQNLQKQSFQQQNIQELQFQQQNIQMQSIEIEEQKIQKQQLKKLSKKVESQKLNQNQSNKQQNKTKKPKIIKRKSSIQSVQSRHPFRQMRELFQRVSLLGRQLNQQKKINQHLIQFYMKQSIKNNINNDKQKQELQRRKQVSTDQNTQVLNSLNNTSQQNKIKALQKNIKKSSQRNAISRQSKNAISRQSKNAISRQSKNVTKIQEKPTLKIPQKKIGQPRKVVISQQLLIQQQIHQKRSQTQYQLIKKTRNQILKQSSSSILNRSSVSHQSVNKKQQIFPSINDYERQNSQIRREQKHLSAIQHIAKRRQKKSSRLTLMGKQKKLKPIQKNALSFFSNHKIIQLQIIRDTISLKFQAFKYTFQLFQNQMIMWPEKQAKIDDIQMILTQYPFFLDQPSVKALIGYINPKKQLSIRIDKFCNKLKEFVKSNPEINDDQEIIIQKKINKRWKYTKDQIFQAFKLSQTKKGQVNHHQFINVLRQAKFEDRQIHHLLCQSVAISTDINHIKYEQYFDNFVSKKNELKSTKINQNELKRTNNQNELK